MNLTGGIYNGRKMQVPDEKITRPTLSKIRMSVFNILYSILGDFEGKSFLDMYGGSGIMGLEALSRGFKTVTVFEKNKQSAQIIKNNYASLGLNPNLYIGDSIKLVKKTDEYYDVVYIDPPYMSGLYEESIKTVANSGIIILEHSENINTEGFNIIKQKQYGDTLITIISMKVG